MGTSGAPGASPNLKRKRPASSTVSSKKRHKFQTFSDRVAAIKVKSFRLDESERRLHADAGDTQPHFRICLDKWKDQNMSAIFTDFVAEVSPFCQSLTQVLHHRSAIVDLLLLYIKKGDVHSLEPLFELLVRLADDLWLRFEEHFERVISAVAEVAATHPDVEAVEWSFDAITGLFKRFSRVLERNLNPLYSLIAPLLGKTKQKAHVTRFSAEAMSFLVRRASSIDASEGSHFHDFVQHVFEDLYDTAPQQQLQYQVGLMTMFADATKSSHFRLREIAPIIIAELLNVLFQVGSSAEGQKLALALATIEGVVTSIIHHSSAESFEPVLNEVLSICSLTKGHDNCPSNVATAARLLYVVAGVRKGTRINHQGWRMFLDALSSLAGTQDIAFSQDPACAEAILQTIAVAFQLAPLELINPRIGVILDKVVCGGFKSFFLQFCGLMNELDPNRFDSVVSSRMRQFIVQHWSDAQDAVLILTPKLTGTLQRSLVLELTSLKLATLCSQITQQPEQLHRTDALMDLTLSQLPLTSTSSPTSDISKPLHAAVDFVLNQAGLSGSHEMQHLMLGRGLHYLIRTSVEPEKEKIDLYKIKLMATSHASSVGYLRALQAACVDAQLKQRLFDGDNAPLIMSLTRNLTGPHHEVRQLSLQVLASFADMCGEAALAQWVKQAEDVENAPLDARDVRTMSLKIRRLGQAFNNSPLHMHRQIIAAYGFGLLYAKLTPLWDDAINVIGQCSSSKECESFVVDLVLEWLQRNPSRLDGQSNRHTSDASDVSRRSSDFQCTNLMTLDHVSEKSADSLRTASEELGKRFEDHNVPKSFDAPGVRSKALLVLRKLPQLAERRSKALVPIFLDWLSEYHESCMESTQLDSDDETLPSPAPSSESAVSREDKKALLQVLASFQNPKAAYRAGEVHAVLMNVLCSGDVGLQKPALEALFAWRNPAITPYQDNLTNLLDDSLFRNELTVFLHADNDDSVIRAEHHAALMPILLRLLYGRAIARTGTKDRGGLVARRKAILSSLARLGENAVKDFLGIAMDPLDTSRVVIRTNPPRLDEHQLGRQNISWRKQIGMLRMIQDVASSLAALIEPFAETLMEGVIFCLVLANRSLQNITSNVDATAFQGLNQVKSVRQEGMKALSMIFSACSDHDWGLYRSIVMTDVLSPRMRDLTAENAQGVSALLRLFATWASNSRLIGLLLAEDHRILPKLAEALSMDAVREEVKQFILINIFASALHLADVEVMLDGELDQVCAFRKFLEDGFATEILRSVERLLSNNPQKELLESSIAVVDQLQPFVHNGVALQPFILVVTSLIDPSRKYLNHLVRSRLLRTLEAYLPQCGLTPNDSVFSAIYDTLSSLFNYFLDVPSRQLLSKVFKQLVDGHDSLRIIGSYCERLNARSSTRLGVADVAAQDEVFAAVSGTDSSRLSAREWQPLVHSFLFLLKDDTDLSAARAGASLCLRCFATSLKDQSSLSQAPLPPASPFWSFCFSDLVEHTLLSAVRRGMREPSETIRGEFLRLLEELVKNGALGCADMKVLLEGQDHPSFFTAVLAAQHSLRLNAWRKLAAEAKHLSPKTITGIFVPLIETTIAQVTEKSQNLVNEAVMTLDKVAECLNWSQYRFLLQRMVTEKKRFDSKLAIRVLSSTVNAFHRARLQKNECTQELSRLAQSLPGTDDLTSVFNKTVLPRLMEFLHFKDESTVDLRIPVAVVTVRIIMAYSPEEVAVRLSAVLMDICNILRSKAQEARDATRRTLAEIANLIGPPYFGFIVKQLRVSLWRGAHLHILSFTLQYLLGACMPFLKPGDLDYCFSDLLSIVSNDIFGTVADEKDNSDYISRTKEVKAPNKSYDSLKLIASVASPEDIADFVGNSLNDASSNKERTLYSLDAVTAGVKLNVAWTKTEDGIRQLLKLFQEPGVRDSDYKIIFCLATLQSVVRSNPDTAYRQEHTRLLEWTMELAESNRYLVIAKAYETIATMADAEGFPLLPDHNVKLFKMVVGLCNKGVLLPVQCKISAVDALTKTLQKHSNSGLTRRDYEAGMRTVLYSQLNSLQDSYEHELATSTFALVREVTKIKIWTGKLAGLELLAMNGARQAALQHQNRQATSAYRTMLRIAAEAGSGPDKQQIRWLLSNMQHALPAARVWVWEMLAWVVQYRGWADALMAQGVAMS